MRILVAEDEKDLNGLIEKNSQNPVIVLIPPLTAKRR